MTPCRFVHWCRNFVEICFFPSHDWRIRPKLTNASSNVPVFFFDSECYHLFSPSLQSTCTILSHPHTNHFDLLGPRLSSLKKEVVYFIETPYTFNTTDIYSPEHTVWSDHHVHENYTCHIISVAILVTSTSYELIITQIYHPNLTDTLPYFQILVISKQPEFKCILIDFLPLRREIGARGDAVGWGTALQVGRLWVRFPILWLEFFIDIISQVALWTWGLLSL